MVGKVSIYWEFMACESVWQPICIVSEAETLGSFQGRKHCFTVAKGNFKTHVSEETIAGLCSKNEVKNKKIQPLRHKMLYLNSHRYSSHFICFCCWLKRLPSVYSIHSISFVLSKVGHCPQILLDICKSGPSMAFIFFKWLKKIKLTIILYTGRWHNIKIILPRNKIYFKHGPTDY